MMYRKTVALIVLSFISMSFAWSSDMTNRVIFLNGPSSCGKSTLTHHLQEALDQPYLHIGIDTVIMMMPHGSNDWQGQGIDVEGFSWELTQDEQGQPLAYLKAGPFGHQIQKLFKSLVCTMLEEGHYVIVDEVCIIEGSFQQWQELLADYPTLYVGLYASDDELEKREQARGDRVRGSSKAQNRIVHRGVKYDLELDTEQLSSEECAKQVLAHINQSSG